MPITRKRRLVVLLAAAVACLSAAVGGRGIYARHARASRLRTLAPLFDGPAEAVAPDPVSYYPTLNYDLSEYTALTDMEEDEKARRLPGIAPRQEPERKWVDGAGKEELERLIRARGKVDGVTSATKTVRLCTPSVFRIKRPSRTLAVSYPPDGALFPPNLCPPCVEWDDARNNAWQVIVRIEGAGKEWHAVTDERRWWFPADIWGEVVRAGVEHDVSIQVKGIRCGPAAEREGPVQISKPVHIRVSKDPADRYVVYRVVPPPFSSVKTPDTFVRDISSFRTRVFLAARRDYCFNCHTFSSKDGRHGKVCLQSRYMTPGPEDLRTYIGIYDLDTRQGTKVILPFDIQMTTFTAWSPDAEKLALSANQQVTAFEPVVYEAQTAGQPTSDVAVYNVAKNTVGLLPGASDPEDLELFPRWTPDGRSIVFCWASGGYHPAMVKYDLRIVPYNDGRGGDALPIRGASNNSRSNYYPRFSPDGKWLSFCQCDGGALIKSASDIYLMKADLSAMPRRLACNARYAADSWHSWSSSGRWIVFSSKRDGVFARLYLTHIDDRGRASPAVRLPLRHVPMMSFNIPEFVAHDPAVGERELYDTISVHGPPAIAAKETASGS